MISRQQAGDVTMQIASWVAELKAMYSASVVVSSGVARILVGGGVPTLRWPKSTAQAPARGVRGHAPPGNFEI